MSAAARRCTTGFGNPFLENGPSLDRGVDSWRPTSGTSLNFRPASSPGDREHAPETAGVDAGGPGAGGPSRGRAGAPPSDSFVDTRPPLGDKRRGSNAAPQTKGRTTMER